jgi:endonuclease/exonuclease/phosphatase family metal-dependent hydrolase/8-oxo-dGTP pyrophosphatase MutT (NUDIX family)
MPGTKIPVSVLVVIHDGQGGVLLIERADHPGFWQSVTGSLDALDEPPALAAQRELAEETGIARAMDQIVNWEQQERYEIFPHWRHRYPEGVTHNTEHWFSVRVDVGTEPRLSPREHTRWSWMPWAEAAERCFSWTNVLAIRELARREGWTSLASNGQASMPNRPLRTASYNIHKAQMRQLTLRSRSVMEELVNGIAVLNADLVCLQEVQGRHDRWALRQGQHERLAELGYETAYGAAAHYLHGHHGNALLSRFPIVYSESRDFSDHALEKRAVLHAVVQLPTQPLHVFVVHFGLLASGRHRQVEHLAAWIRACVAPKASVLVAGDFNDWQLRLGTAHFDGLGLSEITQPGRSAPHRSFPSWAPVLSLDRMFQRGFHARALRRPRGPRWSQISDHVPVLAELEPQG